MAATVSSDQVAGEQLLAFVERIERLEEERKGLGDDIGEVYAEAKGTGFDRRVIKRIVRIRAQNHDERMEALLELYLTAIEEASASRARAREDD